MSGGLASAVVGALSALPQWALALSELLGCLPALALVARIVWLATCARLSPVISAPQLLRLATFSARVIIKRRRSRVK